LIDLLNYRLIRGKNCRTWLWCDSCRHHFTGSW